MITKNFEQWLAEEVEETFGYTKEETTEGLESWLSDLSPVQLDNNVELMRKLLLQNIDSWNEDELKMMFIAPFLSAIQFNNYPHYKVFTQRLSKIESENVNSQGKIEWMIATGRQTPKKPFFFLHEYKPEKSSGNDPLGQLLIAMVYAQKQNQLEMPLYGCYVLGRLWFFVVLEGKKYSVSKAFDSTQKEDLQEIISILQKLKNYIHQYLGLS